MERFVNLGDKKYWIVSCVDSQNAFGATVRTNFVGEVQQVNDGWKLLSLEMSER